MNRAAAGFVQRRRRGTELFVESFEIASGKLGVAGRIDRGTFCRDLENTPDFAHRERPFAPAETFGRESECGEPLRRSDGPMTRLEVRRCGTGWDLGPQSPSRCESARDPKSCGGDRPNGHVAV